MPRVNLSIQTCNFLRKFVNLISFNQQQQQSEPATVKMNHEQVFDKQVMKN